MEALLILSTITLVLMAFLFANLYDGHQKIDDGISLPSARIAVYNDQEECEQEKELARGVPIKSFYEIMNFYDFNLIELNRDLSEGTTEYKATLNDIDWLEVFFKSYLQTDRPVKCEFYCHKIVARGKIFETFDKNPDFLINLDALLVAYGLINIDNAHFIQKK